MQEENVSLCELKQDLKMFSLVFESACYWFLGGSDPIRAVKLFCGKNESFLAPICSNSLNLHLNIDLLRGTEHSTRTFFPSLCKTFWKTLKGQQKPLLILHTTKVYPLKCDLADKKLEKFLGKMKKIWFLNFSE